MHTPNQDYKINFDLVCFGFPCQSLSILMPADQRIGLEDLKKKMKENLLNFIEEDLKLFRFFYGSSFH